MLDISRSYSSICSLLHTLDRIDRKTNPQVNNIFQGMSVPYKIRCCGILNPPSESDPEFPLSTYFGGTDFQMYGFSEVRISIGMYFRGYGFSEVRIPGGTNFRGYGLPDMRNFRRYLFTYGNLCRRYCDRTFYTYPNCRTLRICIIS